MRQNIGNLIYLILIKNMKKLVLSFLLVVFSFSFLLPAEAYVSVKGYYRSNGTYVQPHVRSNPNGLKYDNYGYKPSQGLYNKSYSSGSTNWKTPTWTTDKNYYQGKALYQGKTYTLKNRPKGMSKREFKKTFGIK